MRSKILMFGVFALVLAQTAAYAGGDCCTLKDGKKADKAGQTSEADANAAQDPSVEDGE